MSLDPSSTGWKQRPLDDGFFGLVGALWTRREGEAWAYGLFTNAKHGNRAGVVHGGVLATLMDQAFSAIGWEATGRKPCVTIQLDLKFVAALQPGDFVEARGRVVRQTSRLVFLQGGLTANDNEVAVASAMLKIVLKEKV